MARNHEKYDYAELAFDRESVLYKALAADAAASGKPIGQIAMLRLADYYAGRLAPPVQHSAPSSVPRVPTPLPEPAEQPTTKPAKQQSAPRAVAPPKVGKAIEQPPADEKDPELNEQQASSNIAAFLDQGLLGS